MEKRKSFAIITIALLLFVSLSCLTNMAFAFVPNLTSTAQTETTVTLSWNKSNDLTFDAYIVTYSTTVNGPYSTVATITDKSQTTYAVTGLTPNSIYYFIVQDKYSPDLGITTSKSSSNTYQVNTNANPTLTITAQTPTTASLQWNDYNTYSSQVPFDSYNIQMSTSGEGGPWSTVTQVTDSTQNTYLITGLSTGLYYVQMYDTVGTTGYTQTSYSNVAIIPIVSVSISNTSPTTIDVGQQVQFTATASGGSSNYNYQWYSNGNQISGATSSSLSFNPSSVGSYTVYCTVQDATYTNSQSATSNTMPVTVNPSPNPSNQGPTPTSSNTTPPTQPTSTSNSTSSSNNTLIYIIVMVVAIIVVVGAVVAVALKQKAPKKP
jgi:hypothetical protein